MSDDLVVSLLLALPLAGFLATGLVGRRVGVRAWVIAIPLIVLTSLVALVVVAGALSASYGEEGLRFALWRWIPVGTFQVDVNVAVGQLTAVLLFVFAGALRGEAAADYQLLGVDGVLGLLSVGIASLGIAAAFAIGLIAMAGGNLFMAGR